MHAIPCASQYFNQRDKKQKNISTSRMNSLSPMPNHVHNLQIDVLKSSEILKKEKIANL